MAGHKFKNADSMFALRSGTMYYGMITVMGVNTSLKTHDLNEATLYYKQEAERIKKELADEGIRVSIEPYLEEKIRYSNMMWYNKAKEDGNEFNKKRRRTTKDIYIGMVKL